jgi:hypothetical protein
MKIYIPIRMGMLFQSIAILGIVAIPAVIISPVMDLVVHVAAHPP